jgi:Na+-translocating ferredoxin:NAD+ oxidoreductase RnfG subunit
VRALLKTFAVLAIFFGSTLLHAKIVTREEALKMAFPNAEIKQSMIFLTDEEKKQAAQLAHVPVESGLVARYDAFQNQKQVGRAYLDTHVVRTKKESLLIILNEDGKIRRIEVIAFQEPPEYVPPDRWYQQFEGKSLNEDLELEKKIHPVTGATLTAKSSTESARRILAIDQVLQNRKKTESK